MRQSADVPLFDLERSLGRLNELSTKPDGWKGGESVSMPSSVRDATEAFLRAYDELGAVKDVFVGLDSDGDVTFFLKDPTLILDLTICRDGTYSFFAETPSGLTFQGESLLVTEPLPDRMIEPLTAPESASDVAEQLQNSAD
jgi:hypothetical protein